MFNMCLLGYFLLYFEDCFFHVVVLGYVHTYMVLFGEHLYMTLQDKINSFFVFCEQAGPKSRTQREKLNLNGGFIGDNLKHKQGAL